MVIKWFIPLSHEIHLRINARSSVFNAVRFLLQICRASPIRFWRSLGHSSLSSVGKFINLQNFLQFNCNNNIKRQMKHRLWITRCTHHQLGCSYCKESHKLNVQNCLVSKFSLPVTINTGVPTRVKFENIIRIVRKQQRLVQKLAI